MDDRSEMNEAIEPGTAAQGNTGSSRRRQAVLLLAVSIVLAVGVYLGHELAYIGSQGGIGGALGAVLFGFVIAAVIGLILVFALIAAVFGRSGRTSAGAVAVAGLLVVGILAGLALTPVLGLEYRVEPLYERPDPAATPAPFWREFPATLKAHIDETTACSALQQQFDDAGAALEGQLAGGDLRDEKATGELMEYIDRSMFLLECYEERQPEVPERWPEGFGRSH
jgi:hypothetical protein